MLTVPKIKIKLQNLPYKYGKCMLRKIRLRNCDAAFSLWINSEIVLIFLFEYSAREILKNLIIDEHPDCTLLGMAFSIK